MSAVGFKTHGDSVLTVHLQRTWNAPLKWCYRRWFERKHFSKKNACL